MAYIYYNKISNTFLLFSNLPAVHQNTAINLDTLKYHFYRQNKSEWEKEEFRIIKVGLIKSKRK